MCAPTEYASHQALRGNLAQVIGATNTNGREGRFYSVSLLVGVSNGARDGAKAPLNQSHGGAVFLSGSCLETVVTDLENGVGFQGDDGIVLKAQLRVAIGAGGNRVANEYFRTSGQFPCRPVGSRSDLAGDLDDEPDPGVLCRVTGNGAKSQARGKAHEVKLSIQALQNIGHVMCSSLPGATAGI